MKEAISRFNKSQKARAWVYTLLSLLFAIGFSPFVQGKGDSNLVVFLLFVISLSAFLFYIYQHIKGFITKTNVWKDYKFDLIKDESELDESDTVKKIKKLLYIPLYIFLALFALFVIAMTITFLMDG